MNSEVIKKTSTQKIERATLSKASVERLKKWREEIDIQYQGLIQVSLSDLVNVILESHEKALNEQELVLIKNGRMTELQKAKWIYETVRKAEKDGTSIEISELISKAIGTPKIKKIRRKKEAPTNEKSGE